MLYGYVGCSLTSVHRRDRVRDGPGHWDKNRDARTRILGAGIQGPSVFVLLGRVSQLTGIPGHSTGTCFPVVAPSWDDTYVLTWDHRPINWDVTGMQTNRILSGCAALLKKVTFT